MSSRILVASLDGTEHELVPRFYWRFQDLQKAICEKSGIRLDEQRLLHGPVEIICDSDLYESGILRSGTHALTVVRRPELHVQWMARALGRTKIEDELPRDLCSDKGFLLDVIQHHPCAQRLQSAVRLLLDCATCHHDDLRLATRRNPACYEYFDEDLRKDRTIAEEALCRKPHLLQFAPNDLRTDPSFVSMLIKIDPNCLQHAAEEIRGNRVVVEQAVVHEPHCLEMVSAELKQDAALVMAAVRREPSTLRYAPQLANMRDFLLEAVKVQPAVMLHASETLRKDADFALAVVAANTRALDFIDKEFRGMCKETRRI